jgi:hypothetical protein
VIDGEAEAIEWSKVQEYYRSGVPAGSWSKVKPAGRLWWRDRYRETVRAKEAISEANQRVENQERWGSLSEKERHAVLRFHVEETNLYNFSSLPVEKKLGWLDRYQSIASRQPERHYYIREVAQQGKYIQWAKLDGATRIWWRRTYAGSDQKSAFDHIRNMQHDPRLKGGHSVPVAGDTEARHHFNWPPTDYKLTDGLISSSPGYYDDIIRPQETGMTDETLSDMIEKLDPAHETFAGGGMRESQGDRPRFELLYPKDVPFDEQLLTRCAVHMAVGARKYESRNWEKFSDEASLERAKSSAMRHLVQWTTGATDEDHAAAVVFNLMAAEMIKGKLAKRPW